MANKPRRRSTRNKPVESPEAQPEPVPDAPEARPESGTGTDADKCPACTKGENNEDWNLADKESWVRCDACTVWFHWRCVGEGGDLEPIDKWYCKDCLKEDSARAISLKPPARKSSRKRAQKDYAGLNTGVNSDPNKWLRMLEGKTIEKDKFRRMVGQEVTLTWLEQDETAMREPIVIENQEGLGMKMPSEELTIDEIAEMVGEATPIEVIDVATQSNSPGWTLGKWAEYYSTEPSTRDRIRNVISLEISGTKLGDQVLPPKLVRDLDWVENYWPNTKKGKGHAWPKVQLYCLMGVAGAWTDWHIDFAGSSVYYHILWGKKVFYFIRPTPANLAAYERWSGTEIQNHTWLGDLVDNVCKVELTQGNTMIIPTGWIHAVYTPVDTLVFGGNFLHSYNARTQNKVRDIETNTHVPKKFRFPLFTKLCWYVGDKYLRDLKGKEEFSPRVLESVEVLANFLVSEVRTMEKGSEAAKKEAKDQVPSDRVKDPQAVARELRWRARLAAGHSSDGDDDSKASTSVKRKFEPESTPVLFKNFQPRKWDKIIDRPFDEEKKKIIARQPESLDGWTESWVNKVDYEVNLDEDGGDAEVSRRRTVIVKVRRTDTGIERHRIERVVEFWAWNEGCPTSDPTVKDEDQIKVDS